MHPRLSIRHIIAVLVVSTLFACGDDPTSTEPPPPPPPPPPAVVASVTVSPTPVSLAAGESRALTATPLDSAGNLLSGRTIAWTSTNEAVATVSVQGLVTAIAEGTATIRATVEGKLGTAAVTVLATEPPPASVASVVLDVTTVSLEEGITRQLVATPLDANGQPVPGLTMQWSSSDLTIAGVSNDGVVTAIRPGSATITASVSGKSASAQVTVTATYAFKLIYSGYDGTEMEIFELDINDPEAAPTRILPAGTWAGGARPSPDGTRIAFNGQINGISGLYVMNRDGSNIVRLAGNELGPAINPAWSPDGSKIAFEIIGTPSLADIWVMNSTDGSGRVNLTAGMGFTDQRTPAWSPARPDGSSRIAFVHRENGQERVWTMRPDGTDRRQLTSGVLDEQPAWSPDALTIVFQRSSTFWTGDLWLVNANGTNERALIPGGYPLPGLQMNPVFSPDGNMIAFGSQHETWGQGGDTKIYTVRSDGTDLVRRTTRNGYMPAWIPR